MSLITEFNPAETQNLAREFLQQGYVIRAVEQPECLDVLRHELVGMACKHLGVEAPAEDGDFLNQLHHKVGPRQINDLRLAVYGAMNSTPWLRASYFSLARHVLEQLVGNELAMQNRVNLSIQMPGDESSVLGIHSDAHSGETPFQVVCWLPLVDVFDTKAMFLLPVEANREIMPQLGGLASEVGMSGLMERVRPSLKWVSVSYGQVLVFSSNLLHGNVLNTTAETRWSMNTRFTGLFTPYTSSEKGLGSFYLPITTRVVSRVGLKYRKPGGFDD